MHYLYERSFQKDLEKIKDKALLERLDQVIASVRDADIILNIPGIYRLRSSDKCYKIRIGDYRVGLYFEDDTIYFTRFKHRSEIYHYFP